MKPLYQNYKSILLFMLLVLGIALWSNAFWVEKCSVNDKPIMDKCNKFLCMERDVLASDIDLSIGVYLYIRVPKVTRENLLCLIQLCERAEKFFTDMNIEVGISSLSTSTDYERHDLRTFISREDLGNSHFDINAWYQRIYRKLEVRGKLMGRIEGEYDYFIVSLHPPQAFSEMEMFRLVQAWLENRKLSWWELYFNPDIQVHPSFTKVEIDGEMVEVEMQIDPMGWSIGRGTIDAVNNCDFFKKIIPAIVLVSFLILLIKLGSFRQALIGSMVVSLGCLFLRATIGIGDNIFHLFWKEEVYSVLTYIVCLIPGFSFSMRRFEEFNDADSSLGFWRRWSIADRISFTSMNLIAFVSIIDFLIFMSLTNIKGSRSMFDVGILSAIGLFYAWWLARFFLPALHKLIGGEKRKPQQGRGILNNILDAVFVKSNSFSFAVSSVLLKIGVKSKSPLTALSVLCLTASVAIIFINMGYLTVESDPGEYIDNTQIGLVKDEMKKQGRPGFTVYEVFVSPTDGSDINDPTFVSHLHKYTKAIAENSRTVFGPIDYFISIFQRDYPKEFNSADSVNDAITLAANANLRGDDESINITDLQIRAEKRDIVNGIWNDIRNNSSYKVMKHFLAQNELMLVAIDHETTANGFKRFREMLLSEAESHNILVIKVPAKPAQYADVAKAITDGAIINSIWSQLVIAVICAGWITWHNRKCSGHWKLCPFRTGIIMAVPFIFSTSCIYIIMMAKDIPLDVGTAAIGCISISVAVDLPIFFVAAFHNLVLSGMDFGCAMLQEKMTNEGTKILADFAINTPAFVPVMFSAFLAISYVGFLMVVVMIACTAGTLLLMAPMMSWAVVRTS